MKCYWPEKPDWNEGGAGEGRHGADPLPLFELSGPELVAS